MLCRLICYTPVLSRFFFFFFNDPATTEIYTLSLHDALPISARSVLCDSARLDTLRSGASGMALKDPLDRKSTRLNSSHITISYAVFCLKKKKKQRSDSTHHTPRPLQPTMQHLQHDYHTHISP